MTKSKAAESVTRADMIRQRRERRSIARQHLDYAARRYKQTRNPVFAWDAIADCLSADLSLPDWTRAYLLRSSLEIVRLSRQAVPQKARIDKAVAKALGLQGRGGFNPFREIKRAGHEISLAFRVYQYQTKNRRRQSEGREGSFSWEAIFADVANEHNERCHCKKRVSAATVKNCWYAHALTVIPSQLLARSKSKKLDDILR